MPQIKDFHAKRVLCPVCVNRGMEAHVNFFPAASGSACIALNRSFRPAENGKCPGRNGLSKHSNYRRPEGRGMSLAVLCSLRKPSRSQRYQASRNLRRNPALPYFTLAWQT